MVEIYEFALEQTHVFERWDKTLCPLLIALTTHAKMEMTLNSLIYFFN